MNVAFSGYCGNPECRICLVRGVIPSDERENEMDTTGERPLAFAFDDVGVRVHMGSTLLTEPLLRLDWADVLQKARAWGSLRESGETQEIIHLVRRAVTQLEDGFDIGDDRNVDRALVRLEDALELLGEDK